MSIKISLSLDLEHFKRLVDNDFEFAKKCREIILNHPDILFQMDNYDSFKDFIQKIDDDNKDKMIRSVDIRNYDKYPEFYKDIFNLRNDKVFRTCFLHNVFKYFHKYLNIKSLIMELLPLGVNNTVRYSKKSIYYQICAEGDPLIMELFHNTHTDEVFYKNCTPIAIALSNKNIKNIEYILSYVDKIDTNDLSNIFTYDVDLPCDIIIKVLTHPHCNLNLADYEKLCMESDIYSIDVNTFKLVVDTLKFDLNHLSDTFKYKSIFNSELHEYLMSKGIVNINDRYNGKSLLYNIHKYFGFEDEYYGENYEEYRCILEYILKQPSFILQEGDLNHIPIITKEIYMKIDHLKLTS